MRHTLFVLGLCLVLAIGLAPTASAANINSMLLEAGSWDGVSFFNWPDPTPPTSVPGTGPHVHRWNTLPYTYDLSPFGMDAPETIWGLGVSTGAFGTAPLINAPDTSINTGMGSYYLYAATDFNASNNPGGGPGSNLINTSIIQYNVNTHMKFTVGFDTGDTASAVFSVFGYDMTNITAWTQVWTDNANYNLNLAWGGLPQVNMVDTYVSPTGPEIMAAIWYNDLYFKADVSASPVPIPGAAWLLGSALLGLLGIRRRKK